MNIVVSGWSGAGSSTLSLILADLIGYKLMQGSQTFRFIGKSLGFGQTGIDRITADTFLEKYWGPIYDKYIDFAILNEDHILVESDLAAFRVGKIDNLFSVFLMASLESRKERLKSDSREKDIPLLEQRELEHQKQYIATKGLDWLDKDIIAKKYNLPLESSNLNIAGVLDAVFEKLDLPEKFNTEEIEQLFWQKGKDYFYNSLKSKELLFSTNEIIVNIRTLFPNVIKTFPKVLQDIIYNTQPV